MPKLSNLRGSSLETLTSQYQEHVEQAGTFLKSRGIGREVAARFRLGVVPDDHSGEHKDYAGWLSIPYLTRAGPVQIRFRRIHSNANPKYMQPVDTRAWLYNVGALYASPRVAAIAEGELDAITIHAYADIPTVGMAGVNAWKPEFVRCFDCVDRLLIVADGDNAGTGLVERLMKVFPHKGVDAQMPVGYDAGKFALEFGHEALNKYVMGKI